MRLVVFEIEGVLLTDRHQAHDGVDELLVILKNLGLQLAAITESDYRAIVRLEEAGLRHHFSTVVSPERVNEHFPHALHQALDDMGAQAASTTLVTAKETVVKAGKKAKVQTTVAHMHALRAKRGKTHADHTFTDVWDILGAIG